MAIKTYKISELPDINKVDNEDLLIVSDTSAANSSEFSSRKMQIKKLNDFITKSNAFSNQVKNLLAKNKIHFFAPISVWQTEPLSNKLLEPGEFIFASSGEEIQYAIGNGTSIVSELQWHTFSSSSTTNIIAKTTEEWQATSTDYKPAKGTILIWTDFNSLVDQNTNILRFKVADGTTCARDLTFADDYKLIINHINDMTKHINDTSLHVSDADRTRWNKKLEVDDDKEVDKETLILLRTEF